MKDSKQKEQFRLREVVSDLRFSYFCRAMKSGLSDAEARAELRDAKVDKEILRVARAITQRKTLPIMLFYRCFYELKK